MDIGPAAACSGLLHAAASHSKAKVGGGIQPRALSCQSILRPARSGRKVLSKFRRGWPLVKG